MTGQARKRVPAADPRPDPRPDHRPDHRDAGTQPGRPSAPGLDGGPLCVGGVIIPNRAFLAPMSGVSDLPFRRLAARFGAGLVISEMVAGAWADERQGAKADEARLRAEGEGLPVHAVQIAGREPDAMALGVAVAEEAGADLIDINMGCPAKKVTGGYGGSALMRDMDRALRIIDATVSRARVPVCVKMRLGWDETSHNAPALARRAVDAGVAMITVHGRTRCQFFKGRADWTAIAGVRAEVDVPLVANGDLTRPDDAARMRATTGADAVMIGRGSYGRPWIVGQAARAMAGDARLAAPDGAALRDLIAAHHAAMLTHYGTAIGVRTARKHLNWYLEQAGDPASPALRRELLTQTDPDRISILLDRAFGDRPGRLAA